MMSLINKIFQVNDRTFEQIALEVFHYQLENCTVYADFVKKINKKTPKNIYEIPFLPIEFFKNFEIKNKNLETQTTFKSSGTTSSNRSKHLVCDLSIYEKSFLMSYEKFTGTIENQVILALLPNYVEQGESSLVYMVHTLIQQTNSELSGFYHNQFDLIYKNYKLALKQGKKVVIFGVSYALLDLATKSFDFSKATIIETGGMKGRRKEITKFELHEVLKKGLKTEYISSEYGMTELLSQAYSDKDELFELPFWMKILIRDTTDPFSYVEGFKTGGINVIDLANLNSCSFIATQDLGQIIQGKLKLMGRFDHSDVRGCNLLLA